jgi:photoactive yellow protein
MADSRALSLDAPDLVARVEQLDTEALDALPFGVIRLNAQGEVDYFSRTEAAQSGYRLDRAHGQRFFSAMAPCLGTPALMGRIERAQRAGTLDISLDHIGDFSDAQRAMRVRICSTRRGGGLWVFLQRHA